MFSSRSFQRSDRGSSVTERMGGETTFEFPDCLDTPNFALNLSSGIRRSFDARAAADAVHAFARELACPAEYKERRRSRSAGRALKTVGDTMRRGLPLVFGFMKALKGILDDEESLQADECRGDEAATDIEKKELQQKLDTAAGVVELFTSESRVFFRTAEGDQMVLPFYKALNRSLAHDHSQCLGAAMPYIVKLIQFIVEESHSGGTVYCGTTLELKPAELAEVCGTEILIPRFLSTSSDRREAEKFARRKPGGLMLQIEVPPGFQGARDISHLSRYPQERETLFACWSSFRLTRVEMRASPVVVFLDALQMGWA